MYEIKLVETECFALLHIVAVYSQSSYDRNNDS